MFGIGQIELMVILVIFVIITLFIIVQIWLSLFLRRKYPGKIWIGLILGFLFAPFGQLYVEGATIYIIILVVLEIILFILEGVFEIAEVNFLYLMILSALIMYRRLINIKKKTGHKEG